MTKISGTKEWASHNVNCVVGCSHNCRYCVSPDTLVLMANWISLPIDQVKVGDKIIGVQQEGKYHKYCESTVLDKWETHQQAFRIDTDITSVICSDNHRWLTDRGWKYTCGKMVGKNRRPYLTTNNNIRGIGRLETKNNNILGKQLKSSFTVNNIADLNYTCRMIDISTSTENFIANGLIAHNCYARANALRFKRIEDAKAWCQEKVNYNAVEKKYGKKKGTIMFPTTHDITPNVLEDCSKVLTKLVSAGNQVLVVSKPHLSCIKRICDELAQYRDQIMFRFTIGAIDDDILSYWEPNAPFFAERVNSLAYAYRSGFRTSVSVEPMLDGEHVVRLFYVLKPFVTDSIWIGKMNQITRRVKIANEEDLRMVQLVEDGQTDDSIHRIYEFLKDEPLVRWKESFKTVLGLPLAEEVGLDV